MTPAWGAVVAALATAGVLLFVAALPVFNRPTLAERVLPYVMPADPVVARRGSNSSARATRLIRRTARSLDRWLGGRSSLEDRLRRAGEPVDVEGFRFNQVVKAFAGAGVGVGIALLLSVAKDGFRPGPVALLMAIGAFVGVVLHERALDARVRRREGLIVAQFPAVAEMLALSVAAGEGISGAIERVADRSSGPLAQDLSGVLADARMGTGLVQALRDLGDRTHVVALSRFVDAITVAIERGTPLAEVLRAQAGDVRDAGRRSLMESAGRKEIAMMVPVVFLVLPVTVVFALFPGFFGLALDV